MLRKSIGIFAIFGYLAVPAVAAAANYAIDFKLTNSAGYTSAQFTVNFASAPGQFSGDGGSVVCTANAALNTVAAHNETGTLLKVGLIKTTDFTGPAVLTTCTFASTGGAPTTGQFSISVVDWTASHGTPPTIAITRIQAL